MLTIAMVNALVCGTSIPKKLNTEKQEIEHAVSDKSDIILTEIEPAIEYPSQIPEDGIGNKEFNQGQGINQSKFAYKIKHLYKLNNPIGIKELKSNYNISPPRKYIYVSKYIVFPGGKIEPGETPEDAAKREVFEETNLIIEDLEIVGKQDFDAKNQGRVGYLVKANKYSGEIKIKELDKIADIQFKRIDYEFAVNRLFYAIIFETD
ncbi:23586_t:CDS:2 [Gigaspora margarita]|uniref:23586_t:CDS:1 n=1 Tax=Gigaspora margarita TaxID=4874 RepID=A0ABM8VZ32_GIGMA|nr:23586_t:CDS:2 [Gigaspora margarita]